MKSKIHFSSATDNWSTPKDVYEALNTEFKFDFDPCPLNETPDTDGLTIEWGNSNFVNPPYSQLKKWLYKGYEEAQKGKTVVLLIPSRTDTIAWHDVCMKANEIRFIKGRLKFGGAKHSAPFPSAVIIFKSNIDYSLQYRMSEKEFNYLLNQECGLRKMAQNGKTKK